MSTNTQEDSHEGLTEGSRIRLKKIFRKGMTPTQEEFYFLIDTVLNVQDDPITPRDNGGVKIISGTTDQSLHNLMLIEFQESRDDSKHHWELCLQGPDAPQQGIAWGFMRDGKPSAQPLRQLVLAEEGNVGISTANPKHSLDVGGSVGMETRIGTYFRSTFKADGQWYTMIDNETPTKQHGYFAVEVLAYIVPPKAGLGYYAITHAVCVGAYPHRRSTFWEWMGFHNRKGIQLTQSYFEKKQRQIELRWSGSRHQPMLQIRTRSRLRDANIHVHVTNLMPQLPNIPQH